MLEWNTHAQKNIKIITDLFTGIRKLLYHNHFQFFRTQGTGWCRIKEQKEKKQKEFLVTLKRTPNLVSSEFKEIRNKAL